MSNSELSTVVVVDEAVKSGAIDATAGAIIGLGFLFFDFLGSCFKSVVTERDFAEAAKAELLRDAIMRGERFSRKEMNEMLGTYDLEVVSISYRVKLDERVVEKSMKRFLWIF